MTDEGEIIWDSWAKWGLSATRFNYTREVQTAHDLVANYLDRHPDAAVPWRTGALGYFEVLRLARAEITTEFEGMDL